MEDDIVGQELVCLQCGFRRAVAAAAVTPIEEKGGVRIARNRRAA